MRNLIYIFSSRLKRDQGFSLIEVVTALFISALALPAIAYVFSVSGTTDSDSKATEQAYFLANSLINEISSKRFRESSVAPGNGVDDGETNAFVRTGFDDIDDYHIFSGDWGIVHPPMDMTGIEIPGVSQFSQWVEVVNIASPTDTNQRNIAAVDEGSTNTKLVTVKISWDSGRREVVVAKVFSLP